MSAARTGAAATRGTVWSILAAAVWRFRRRTLVALLLVAAAKLATVAVPLVLKRIVDVLGRPETLTVVPIALLAGYAIMRFLGTFFSEVRDVVFSHVTQRTVSDFLTRVFDHLHALSPRFHTIRQTGALTRDIERGTAGIGFLLGVALFTVIPTLVEIVTVVAILASGYDYRFTLIVMATFLFYSGFTLVFTERRAVHQRALNKLDSWANNRIVDSLLNYETVKYYTGEKAEAGRFSQIMTQWIGAGIDNQKALTQLHIGQSAVIAVGVASVMLLAGQLVVRGTMTVGDLVLINAFVIQICLPLNSLGFVFREAKDASMKAERLFELLGEQPEIRDAPDAQALQVTAAEIRFDQVNFSYSPDQPVLHDVSFRIAPGSTTAVVGGSGSGKSTLVRLLLRFYDLSSGSITIDGQDIRHVTQASLRAAIGVVPQDTVLFNDTIGYNIGYARPDATVDDIRTAARIAQLDEFIQRLPQGYDTIVGERGLRLSGGERQRLAIARAVLKNAPILIFDEATSALDTRAERTIQEQFAQLARNRTALIIAHRLSTVVDADEILVLEHGRIVERGTHDELLRRQGLYAQMWRLQQHEREMERMGMHLAMQTINLAVLAADVIDGLRPRIEARRINLYSVIDGEPVRVTGDPGRLHKLIWDILDRALGIAAPGSRVELRLQRDGPAASIAVINNMLGGEADTFAPGTAMRNDAEATVQDHGGRLRIDRDHALLQLPLRAVAIDVAMLADARARQSAPHALDEHVLDGIFALVIDDSAEARDLLATVLRLHGARVEAVATGAAALDFLRARPARDWPAILLCDIALADEDGYAVIQRIRALENERETQLHDRLPAIAVTGYSSPGDRMRILLAGFQMHLTKPVDAAELVAAVASIVRRDITLGGNVGLDAAHDVNSATTQGV